MITKLIEWLLNMSVPQGDCAFKKACNPSNWNILKINFHYWIRKSDSRFSKHIDSFLWRIPSVPLHDLKFELSLIIVKLQKHMNVRYKFGKLCDKNAIFYQLSHAFVYYILKFDIIRYIPLYIVLLQAYLKGMIVISSIWTMFSLKFCGLKFVRNAITYVSEMTFNCFISASILLLVNIPNTNVIMRYVNNVFTLILFCFVLIAYQFSFAFLKLMINPQNIPFLENTTDTKYSIFLYRTSSQTFNCDSQTMTKAFKLVYMARRYTH